MEIYIIALSHNTQESLRKRRNWKDFKSQWQLKTVRKQHLIDTRGQLCILTHIIHKTEKHPLDLCKFKPDQAPVCRGEVGIKTIPSQEPLAIDSSWETWFYNSEMWNANAMDRSTKQLLHLTLREHCTTGAGLYNLKDQEIQWPIVSPTSARSYHEVSPT